MTEAPIWQQEEGGTRFDLAPAGRGGRWLALTARDVRSGRGPVARGLSPIALLDPDEAAALRDALTAWLDEGATA